MITTIQFFSEDTSFQLDKPDQIKSWLHNSAIHEGFSIHHISLIFCSDKYLHDLNKRYLQHDSYTDIITFDQSEGAQELEADIFISVDRVQENAHLYKVSMGKELSRLMIHGMLHLMGYSDKTKDGKLEMRKKEEAYLSLQESNSK